MLFKNCWSTGIIHTQPSLGIIENGVKQRKHLVSSSCVDKAMLMWGIMGEWGGFNDGEKGSSGSNNHLLQPRTAENHLWTYNNTPNLEEVTIVPPVASTVIRSPMKRLWHVVERERCITELHLQQPRDAIASIWSTIFLPRRIKAVLKTEVGSNLFAARRAY